MVVWAHQDDQEVQVRHMQHEMGGLRKHKSQRRYMYHFHVCRVDRLPWHAGLCERTDVAVHMYVALCNENPKTNEMPSEPGRRHSHDGASPMPMRRYPTAPKRPSDAFRVSGRVAVGKYLIF